MVKKCPRCNLLNPGEAQRCDCGYDFVSQTMEDPYDVKPHHGGTVLTPGSGSRVALIGLAAILGIPVGAFLGFFATIYACVLHSGEAAQVGWIFCFFTVPAGAVVGSVLGALVTAWTVKRAP